ncbi:TPA: hypothetical protein HA235_04400 [Candidatus Woesearchaeota archaeon]|nr:hypothetical protein [Candidatus Woesearchaeota archaeon]HIH31923.1 hypothetical protein [Candidatus Woesearchaeota archaeon]HIH55507.1 hypothetical protein [Candidatus Woesearchaeota archaeon]HIJ01064.1 hypothetical protein [Candidatus Woesearchaeota archaeon]HIJ14711.1 hypothetical protein [Candidatus Woesearchaeota archaeon]
MEKIKTIQIKAPSVSEVMGKNLPEKKFRSGAIAATIWANEVVRDGKKVSYRTVSFERSYKAKDDEWKTTNSLRIADIPRATLVLNKAYEYLALYSDEIEEDIYA